MHELTVSVRVCVCVCTQMSSVSDMLAALTPTIPPDLDKLTHVSSAVTAAAAAAAPHSSKGTAQPQQGGEPQQGGAGDDFSLDPSYKQTKPEWGGPVLRVQVRQRAHTHTHTHRERKRERAGCGSHSSACMCVHGCVCVCMCVCLYLIVPYCDAETLYPDSMRVYAPTHRQAPFMCVCVTDPDGLRH